MHMSKPTSVPIVKGNRFGNFKCFRNQYEIDQMNMVPYASAVGSSMSAQVRTYPDIVHISELFWQKSNLDIDHWNEVKNVGLMLS
jgi:hypothetical protein